MKPPRCEQGRRPRSSTEPHSNLRRLRRGHRGDKPQGGNCKVIRWRIIAMEAPANTQPGTCHCRIHNHHTSLQLIFHSRDLSPMYHLRCTRHHSNPFPTACNNSPFKLCQFDPTIACCKQRVPLTHDLVSNSIKWPRPTASTMYNMHTSQPSLNNRETSKMQSKSTPHVNKSERKPRVN